MRACEGCRRRKIKCDAATTNTWPCSACVRLKLHCVRPNGYDGSTEPQVYEPTRSHQFESSHDQQGYRQQLPLPDQQQLGAQPAKQASVYGQQPPYQDGSAAIYHGVHHYNEPQTLPHPIQYPSVHHSSVNVVDQSYSTQPSFSTPPVQQSSHPETPSDYSDQYPQQDLADLLGSLKVNEAGTGEKQTF